MREFRIQVVTGDEIVIDFPLNNKVIHNGLGGGTETPLPNLTEKRAIISLLMALKKQIFAMKPMVEKKREDNP